MTILLIPRLSLLHAEMDILSKSLLCSQLLSSILTDLTYSLEPSALLHIGSRAVTNLTRLSKLTFQQVDQNYYLHVSDAIKWICHLPALHTLSLSQPSNMTPEAIASMYALQKLELSLPKQRVCDLSRCTQLTHLQLELSYSNRDLHLLLPRGNNAQLCNI